jgi:hypothetical protein
MAFGTFAFAFEEIVPSFGFLAERGLVARSISIKGGVTGHDCALKGGECLSHTEERNSTITESAPE